MFVLCKKDTTVCDAYGHARSLQDALPLSDVERAVAAAKAAFPAWRDLAPGARGDALRAMTAKVADNAEELCALLVQETGRPMALAQFEILHLATGYLTYYAGLRSDEHTSEPQSLMRLSYSVSCFKKNNTI